MLAGRITEAAGRGPLGYLGPRLPRPPIVVVGQLRIYSRGTTYEYTLLKLLHKSALNKRSPSPCVAQPGSSPSSGTLPPDNPRAHWLIGDSGAVIMIGGPMLINYVQPSEEELFKVDPSPLELLKKPAD